MNFKRMSIKKIMSMFLVIMLFFGVFGIMPGEIRSKAVTNYKIGKKVYKVKVVDVEQNHIYFKFTSKKKVTANSCKVLFKYQKTGKKESQYYVMAKKQKAGKHKGTYCFRVNRYGTDLSFFVFYKNKYSKKVKTYTMPSFLTKKIGCNVNGSEYTFTWGTSKGAAVYLVECSAYSKVDDAISLDEDVSDVSFTGKVHEWTVKDSKCVVDIKDIGADFIEHITVTPLGKHGEFTPYTQISDKWINPDVPNWFTHL